MNYGRTKEGEKWHIEKDGRALCGPFELTGVVEDRPEEVCGNCDTHLRFKGVEARRAARKPAKPSNRAPRQTVYAPRHKFEDA
jgi:hypothetical protein